MKARYYEYSIQYKHRKYRILTPQSLPDEMYLCCNYYKNSDSDYIDGDRYTFQSLRNAAVTLALMNCHTERNRKYTWQFLPQC